jgi:toxin ParE1/3/4
MAEYRLSPTAERDLEGIWKYTRRECGLEQAERYTDLLTAAFQVLAESPKLAPACDHTRQRYRRRNVERHMIYFRLTDYGIAIIRILHERMDAPNTCKTDPRASGGGRFVAGFSKLSGGRTPSAAVPPACGRSTYLFTLWQ